MSRNRFLALASLLVFSGCSTLNSLNPFSSSDTQSSDDGRARLEESSESETVKPSEGKTADAAPVQKPASKAAWLASSSQISPNPGASVPVVAIAWQRPAEPVSAYILKYGTSADSLTQTVRVPVAELEKADDPRQGPLYRYRLKNIPTDRSVFFTLQAENESGVSAPTPVAEVAANSF